VIQQLIEKIRQLRQKGEQKEADRFLQLLREQLENKYLLRKGE
jgi:hypothetical protein